MKKERKSRVLSGKGSRAREEKRERIARAGIINELFEKGFKDNKIIYYLDK